MPKFAVTPGAPGTVYGVVKDRSDAELVAAVLKGETDAYAILVRRYQHAYYRFAIRMLGSPDDADDAVQSAFVRAYHALASCRNPERFGAWGYQIVVNECRTMAVTRQRRELRFVGVDMALLTGDDGQSRRNREEMQEIQRALNRLDPDQREAFILKHVEELEYEEMATLTGASVSALKMRVKRARDRLQQLLEPVRNVS
jgi:RNA polymerase sigma-70 factor (ECF subfamily)